MENRNKKNNGIINIFIFILVILLVLLVLAIYYGVQAFMDFSSNKEKDDKVKDDKKIVEDISKDDDKSNSQVIDKPKEDDKDNKENTTVVNENIVEKKIRDLYVTSKGLNVRSGPSISNNIVDNLSQNDKIEELSRENSWVKVRTSRGIIGYVSQEFVSEEKVVEVTEEKNETILQVSAELVNLRKDPSSDSIILGMLSKDSKVYVVSFDANNWVKVKTEDGIVGYILADYLK